MCQFSKRVLVSLEKIRIDQKRLENIRIVSLEKMDCLSTQVLAVDTYLTIGKGEAKQVWKARKIYGYVDVISGQDGWDWVIPIVLPNGNGSQDWAKYRGPYVVLEMCFEDFFLPPTAARCATALKFL